MMVNCWFS